MLALIVCPNPILRKQAAPVRLPVDAALHLLAKEMLEVTEHYRGIGLAAPQVGQGLRIIVVTMASGLTVCLNPEIARASYGKVDFEEGCLSIPGVYGTVPRPERVLVAYTALAGGTWRGWLDGLPARIFQHEVDHLHGVLFTERAREITQGAELLPGYGLG